MSEEEVMEEVFQSYLVQLEDEYFGEDWLDSYLPSPKTILDAKYEKLDVDTFAKEQSHLTCSQQDDLRDLLRKHERLFSGELGLYPHKKMHIELEPNAEPVHARAYSVPRMHEDTFKKELDHLVALGVLSYQGVSEWASPSFIIPKKDGRVRWISDLRALNKVIKRKVYPLPLIDDVLRKRNGYQFFSKLDISMQYYTFELDEESKELCTIVTPFGKYKYERLPMGLKCSPDFAQEVMENIFHDMKKDLDVYIDDVGCFSESWEHHIKLLDEVLRRLKDNGFTVNPLKCEWGVKETDWLGYWLTPTGLKPWKKKIDAILQLKPPTNLKEMRSFLGAVNYYKDMWPRRAHVLKPLTDETGKRKFKWTDDMQKAFEQMKAIISEDCLRQYPDHNKPFQIYTDASDYQMGACIMQEGKPVAYWSKKLNSAQRNYTTMEKELLSIVSVLDYYRTMLLGAKIDVYTDHRNLTFKNLNTQRVLRWRVKVEEFGPSFHYIPGPENVLGDALSRVPRSEGTSPHNVSEPHGGSGELEESRPSPDGPMAVAFYFSHGDSKRAWEPHGGEEHMTISDHSFFSLVDDKELLDCFLNLPPQDVEENPLNFKWIAEEQSKDAILERWRQRLPDQYFNKRLQTDTDVLCYVKPGDDPAKQWKIALPKASIVPVLKWFHEVLGHPGEERLRQAVSARFHHNELRRYISQLRCDACQRHKLDGKGYGLLPEREVTAMPFNEVAVDLIGPWTIEVNGRSYEFNALTSIDLVTNLVELIRIDRKTSQHVRKRFEQSWLSRYPLPKRCIHDNEGEFTGAAFQGLLNALSIKDVPTTSRNPQANAVCERMHQTVGNVLRTILYSNPPQNVTGAADLVDQALATAMHAMRVNVSTTLGSSPGALVFGRDMFLDVPLEADWLEIQKRRRQLVNESLRRANMKRRTYDYVQGQDVLKKLHNPTKLGERTEGPFPITQVHTNGTVTISLRPEVTERINIRRVIPYRPPT